MSESNLIPRRYDACFCPFSNSFDDIRLGGVYDIGKEQSDTSSQYSSPLFLYDLFHDSFF